MVHFNVNSFVLYVFVYKSDPHDHGHDDGASDHHRDSLTCIISPTTAVVK